MIKELVRARSGVDAFAALLRYALLVTSLKPEALKEALELQPGTPAMEALMTTAEQLREEGRKQGEALGEIRGRAETVIKLLSLRFGPLPEAAVQRIRSASAADLDALAERVLSARSLDEALG